MAHGECKARPGTSCENNCPESICRLYRRPAPARAMADAPLDGTLVQLLVRFDNHAIEDTTDPTWTMGSHNDGEWNFVGWDWHRDEWTRGSGDLLGWLPVGPNVGDEGRSPQG